MSKFIKKLLNLYYIAIIFLFRYLYNSEITLIFPELSLINHDPQLLIFGYLAEHTKMKYVQFGILLTSNLLNTTNLWLSLSQKITCEVIDETRSLLTGHHYTLDLPISNEHHYGNEIYLEHLFPPSIYLIHFKLVDNITQKIILIETLKFELRIKYTFLQPSQQKIYKQMEDIKVEINLSIGIGTYHDIQFMVTSRRDWDIHIGKYCSIATIEMFLGRSKDHRNDFITTFPLHFLQDHFSVIKDELVYENSHQVNIGNDVWIGKNVVLINNITIGNGVIIGADSVIRNNIPDYAIVYGNPGIIIKYRFNNEIINKLRIMKWWDWSEERVHKMTKYSAIEDIILSWEHGEI